MNIIGYIENKKSREVLGDALRGSSYTYTAVDLSRICSRMDWSSHDIIVMDAKAWQYGNALFKYFGVLPEINGKPMLVLASDTKAKKLKMRDSKHPFLTVSPYSNSTEILSSIEQLMNTVETVES